MRETARLDTAPSDGGGMADVTTAAAPAVAIHFNWKERL